MRNRRRDNRKIHEGRVDQTVIIALLFNIQLISFVFSTNVTG